MPVQIDPKTGERIQAAGAPQIDPATGERISAPAAQPKPQTPAITDTMGAAPTWKENLSNLVRHPLNTLESAAQPVSRPTNASMGEMAAADVANVGAGAASVLRHPLKTIGGAILSGVRSLPPVAMAEQAMRGTNLYGEMYDQANTNGPQFGAYSLGQAAASAPLVKAAGKPAGMALENVGGRMQDAGAGLINHTVGSLQRDFRHGADPGRAYLDAGGGPALSMDSMAGKAGELKNQAGQQLGSAYQNATQSGVKIPVGNVTSALRGPISKARSIVAGPGGTGDTAPIRQFGASFAPPIQKAVADGGFSPSDLWDIKKNVAKNTSWSDPSQVGMKSLRQETTGALSGTLSDALPETKPLNTQYQGLTNLANRATLRAQSGSMPLTRIAGKLGAGAVGGALGATHSPLTAALMGVGATAIDSVPVKTGVASAMYQGGRGAVAIGKGLQGLYSSKPPTLSPASSPLVPPGYELSNGALVKRVR